MDISRREALGVIGATALGAAFPTLAAAPSSRMQSWPLNTPRHTGIHDIAPASDRGVWFTAQASGHLGYFDPATGKFERFGFPREGTNIRQILGRHGEVWLPESGTETISVIRTGVETENRQRNTCAFRSRPSRLSQYS